MRIWAFPSFYPYDYPGVKWTGTFAHFQYKGLIANGADLKVIQPILWNPPYPVSEFHPEWKKFQKLSYPSERFYDGVKVYHPRIANIRPNRLVKKSYAERYVDAIVNFFKENRIQIDPLDDIFYSQWLPDCVFVQMAAHKLGIKSAINAIGDDVVVWPKSSENNFQALKKLMLEADLRVANAAYLMKEANRLIGEDLPYSIAYFGVDYNFFKPVTDEASLELRRKYQIPTDKVVILTVGSALVRKGWLDLLDALVQVRKSNDNFVLVGIYAGGSDLNLVDEVEKRGLTPFFINVGEIPPAEIINYYNLSDIFCLPSHWEGLATVVTESMSCGLPVITTDVCGHPEMITTGENGILIPAKQPALIARELLSLLKDKEKRTHLGQNAREFMVNKWGNATDNTAALYKKMKSIIQP